MGEKKDLTREQVEALLDMLDGDTEAIALIVQVAEMLVSRRPTNGLDKAPTTST